MLIKSFRRMTGKEASAKLRNKCENERVEILNTYYIIGTKCGMRDFTG